MNLDTDLDADPEARIDRARLALLRAVRDTGYRFVTITPASHERVNRRPEARVAQDLAGVFGWSRPFAADLLPAPMLERMREADAIEPHGELWRSRVRFSTLAGETFLHSAYPTTGADAVFFGPDTYRFVAAIRRWLAARDGPIRRAADVCCGAGPAGIVIAKACPQAEVDMLDINAAALRAARVNAAAAGAANARAAHSDLLDGVPGRFDLVVANPPYLLDPARRTYRHGGGALGEGLSVRIVEAALDRLAPGGTLLLYTGVAIVDGVDPLLAAVAPRLAGTRLAWEYEEIDPDVFGEELAGEAYARADRIAAVVLTVNKAC